MSLQIKKKKNCYILHESNYNYFDSGKYSLYVYIFHKVLQ